MLLNPVAKLLKCTGTHTHTCHSYVQGNEKVTIARLSNNLSPHHSPKYLNCNRNTQLLETSQTNSGTGIGQQRNHYMEQQEKLSLTSIIDKFSLCIDLGVGSPQRKKHGRHQGTVWHSLWQPNGLCWTSGQVITKLGSEEKMWQVIKLFQPNVIFNIDEEDVIVSHRKSHHPYKLTRNLKYHPNLKPVQNYVVLS